MIEVGARAKVNSDRAGDPLDGLVNMFDLGIVLAVAFLIAALQSHDLTQVLTNKPNPKKPSIAIAPNQKIVPVTPGSARVPVNGATSLGQVYQLPDGRLVYVTKK
jgi:hypothetical protein